jgi:PhnB protein
MAKGKLIDQFDEAVEAIMTKPDAPLRSLDPRLRAILRIAGELRDMPRAEFKSNLKARLASSGSAAASSSKPVGGKPLFTHDDIDARIKEMADEPRLVAHDVKAALVDLPDMSMKFIAQANSTTLVVSRATGASWERHPGGDEMIYVVEGAAEILTLTDGGPVRSKLRAGSLFVCPRGLWHKTTPQPAVSAFYLTPGEGTEGSREDPRRSGKFRAKGKRGRSRAPHLEVHDLRAALREVPHLTITADTTGEEADASVRTVAKLDQLSLGVMSYTGLTPWERHPGGDELLYALDGEVEVTVLTDDGPVHETIRAGSAFVCPRGLWHRQLARKSVSMLYGTATDTSEVSFADDPRVPEAPAKSAEIDEPIAAPRRGIMPFMYVEGAARAADFYKQVFGATELHREIDEDGIVSHAQLKIGDTTVMLSDPTARHIAESESRDLSRAPHSYGGSPVHLYVYVANVDEVFKRAIEAGAKVIDQVEDKEWGDRCGGIEDPFGHVWFVGTPLKDLAGKKSN